MRHSLHIACLNEDHIFNGKLIVSCTMFMFFASLMIITDVVYGQKTFPQEVVNRKESGEMKDIRSLLLEENPEYSR